MLKRSIKTFILGFVLSLICVINVNAVSLENVLEPGDIIIGNTVFRADDWISASRASKAGALYAMNTGKTDVRVFYYDDFEDWYEYNDATSKYELIKEPTLSVLEDIIEVYYDNNEPLMNTYESYVEYEYDSEYDEYYPIDSNHVFEFFYIFEEKYLKLDDNNVTLDFENETITCPYGYIFDFEYNYEDDEIEKFKGICGTDEFKIETEEDYNYEKLEIENIELVSLEEDENLVNQEKVSLYYDNDDNFSWIDININEELEESLPLLAPITSTYVAVDIKLKGESKYELLHDLDSDYTILEDKDSIRLYLTAENYGFNYYTITLLDYKYGTFKEIYIYFNGMERLDYDFTLENIINGESAYDEEMQNNNDSIYSIDVFGSETNSNVISINMVGDLLYSEFNNYPAKWLSVDLFFNEEVNYEYLNVEWLIPDNYDTNYDYEILGDRLRLYFEYDEERNQFPYSINILDEQSGNNLHYVLVFNNYYEENFISADNGFEGIYVLNYEDEVITKASINSSFYYNLYYDEETSRLYYKNTSDILFKDATSLNLLTFNESGRPIVQDNVDMLEVYVYNNNIGEEVYSYGSPYKLETNPDLYDRVTNNIETYEFDIEKVLIYTFFKGNTNIPELERAKFDSLIESGKVEIIDISNVVYETE